MTETYRHKTPIQIRFNDLDAYNHVNNNVYASYYDLGKESYFADVLKCDFRLQNVVFIVAHIAVDFIEPIHYGDEIVVETRVSHIGTKSFTLTQQARNMKTDRVVCKGETVMVCIRLKTGETTEMPQEYREAFENFEAGR